MNNVLKRIIIIIAGGILAIISIHCFSGWINIIPWMACTMLLGYVSKDIADAVLNGALFGYFLFLAYIFLGYQGEYDAGHIQKFVVFTLLFSMVGALAGIIGAFIGAFVRKKIKAK